MIVNDQAQFFYVELRGQGGTLLGIVPFIVFSFDNLLC